MIYPIQMISISDRPTFLESLVLEPKIRPMDLLYTEAVFQDGKPKLKPVEAAFEKVKSELESEIQSHTKEKPFNPESFWRHTVWKDLEDSIQKVFNFRHVIIAPFVEKYSKEDDEFESKVLNCMVWSNDRFPIDGIVTDKGFYDSTKSCHMEIYVSLGLIRALTPQEITAVFLHEFGHGVDPALVDIKYVETNVLSKYLTDRKKEVKPGEKKAIGALDKKISFLRTLFHIQDTTNKFTTFIQNVISKINDKKPRGIIWPWDNDKVKLQKIEKELQKDKSRFTRQDYTEAYADNFARMYGYGVPLISALKKMSAAEVKKLEKRHKNEKVRQREIAKIIIAALNDDHKTSLTRALALQREMKNDINDPSTPPKVKEQLREELKELESIIDSYQNDFSDFQNNCYKLIIDDFNAKEAAAPKTDDSKPSDDTTKPNESTPKSVSSDKDKAAADEPSDDKTHSSNDKK